MKLLLDQNISYRIIKLLHEFYPEMSQIGRLGMAQTDDAMVWQYARTHNYILVTFDAYFHERNLISGYPIKIIWLQCQDTSTNNVVRILKDNYAAIKSFYEDENHTCLEFYD
ncbi:MAG: DUF5615 family PIN-like protein [Bacteroidia bacterium]|nr:DUF5615 family PIN-like protein [Bacteroidia bacterium]